MHVPYEIVRFLRKNPATCVLAFIVVTRLLMLFMMAPTYRIGEDVFFLRIGKYIATSGDMLPLTEPVFGTSVFYGPILYWVEALLYILAPQVWILLAKAFNLALFFGSLFILTKIASMFRLSETEKAVTYGLFGFLSASVALSLTAMHGGLLTFGTMLAAWCVLRPPDRWSYAGLFLASGLVMMTRLEGMLSVAAIVLMIVLLKTGRKQRFKLLTVLVAGIVALSGWWLVWNFGVHGTPFYHINSRISAFSLDYALTTPIGAHAARIIDAYSSSLGIPLGGGVFETSLFNLPEQAVSILRVSLGLFFLPLFGLFIFSSMRQRKELLVLLPLPVIYLFLHGLLYVPVITGNAAAQYMLPGIPLFALIMARSLSLFNGRQRKIVLAYMTIAIVLLAALATCSQYYKTQHENAFLSDFSQLLKENPNKTIVMLQQDDIIRGMVDLHFNIIPASVQEMDCRNTSTLGMLRYCVQGQSVSVWTEGFYLFKKF